MSLLPQVCLHSRPITSLALTADGTHFFTAAGDGAVFMCKVQVRTKRKNRKVNLSLLFDARRSNSSNFDKRVRLTGPDFDDR